MPTVKVILTPKNHSITNQDKAKAVWLIKKYTSHAWIKRTKEAIETFIPKYEEYISKRGALEWRKDTLLGLRRSISLYEQGLSGFENGKYQMGSDLIMDGTFFTEWLEDPHTELAQCHFEIGYRDPPEKSLGIYKIAALALDMALKTNASYTASQRFPDILEEADFPDDILERIDPLSPISTRIVTFEEEIPTTGIWLPVNHPFACPNYFEAGYSENSTEVPISEERNWDTDEEFKNNLPAKTQYFSHKEIEGKFILLWEEDRYRKGKIPDESVYLDPSTEIPDEPLILFPPKR